MSTYTPSVPSSCFLFFCKYLIPFPLDKISCEPKDRTHPIPFSLDNASCELQDRTSPLASSVCTVSCSRNPFSYVPNPQICMGPTCYHQRAASLGNAHVGEDSPTIYLNLISSGIWFRTIDVRLSLLCKGSWVVFAARGQFLWAYGQGSTFSCIHTYLHFSRLGRFT